MSAGDAKQRFRKLSKREAKRRRLARALRADAAREQRWAVECRDQGVDPTVAVYIPRRIWVRAWSCHADASGRTLRQHLARMQNKVRAGAARRAILCPREDGRPRFHWSDPSARVVGALAIGLDALAVCTRRPGRFQGLVKGIPQTALLGLLRNPHTKSRPHRNALAGKHRAHGSLEHGGLSYIGRLIAAGFMAHTQQLREGEGAEPCELVGKPKLVRFRDGHEAWVRFATNRMWLVTHDPSRPLDEAARLELIAMHSEGQRLTRELRDEDHAREQEHEANRERDGQPPPPLI